MQGGRIEKLTDKCGNEEIAKLLYDQCKLNTKYYKYYIRWVSFDEFKNIEYSAKCGFGEVHRINGHYNDHENKSEDISYVKKNSIDDKIVDILKEVNKLMVS